MKAFISVNEPTLETSLNERFARAPYFIIVDTETGKLLKTLDNTFRDGAHGVGIRIATMAASEGIDCVIGAHLGPKVMDVLRESNIKAYNADIKMVSQIIEDCRNNNLKEAI